jgi:hypothetical protein
MVDLQFEVLNHTAHPVSHDYPAILRVSAAPWILGQLAGCALQVTIDAYAHDQFARFFAIQVIGLQAEWIVLAAMTAMIFDSFFA